MTNSKYAYVKNFEITDTLLPNAYIVVRLDGRSFNKFSKEYRFKKPNDRCALQLMNKAAFAVMHQFQDIEMAYGQSDEYSFVFSRTSELFDRRSSKLNSTVASTFTATYVYHWNSYFEQDLKPPLPTFDARVIVYPTLTNVRDYLSWRQVDCNEHDVFL